jgi:hypothetical protein
MFKKLLLGLIIAVPVIAQADWGPRDFASIYRKTL